VTAVHFVVPDGIDDPGQPSGGNAYDRHVRQGLGSLGWSVRVHAVTGCWPRPDAAAFAALARVVRQIPDGAVALLDGLVASTAPEVLVPQARRLRLVVLVHMALGQSPADDSEETRMRERAVLSAAAAVVTTSAWTRRRLLALYHLSPGRVHVAEPGVEAGELAAGSVGDGALLCVAAVSFEKGHDVLLDALLTLSDLRWRCVCVGSLERDPAFVGDLRRRALDGGLGDRVRFAGPLADSDVASAYAAADLLVVTSRAESYGMVVTEALARGLPVIATEVGGLTEALGYGADGIRPGLLVAPGDPPAFAAALRTWLCDHGLRARLRRAACERRESLCGWSTTASAVAGVLAEVSR
jgi:glycosyltransferase involved in cell wall biosynthesis